MESTNAINKQIILEQRKEISRLQKLLAKTEVKKDSEIAALKAQLSESKKKQKFIVTWGGHKNTSSKE